MSTMGDMRQVQSAAKGEKVCPNCMTTNPASEKYCVLCGVELVSGAASDKPAFEADIPTVDGKAIIRNPGAAFATGMPDWDLEPPVQLIGRRH